MAGIVFPDVAGSVLPALQIQKSQQLMDLEASRQRKLDAEQERQTAAGQYVPGALKGDEEAFNNLAKYSPDMAIKLRLYADQKKHAEMQNAQEGAKALSSGAGAVMAADPGDRPTAYQAYLTSLKARGLDVSAMPQQYSPAVDSLLNFHFNTGVGADKLLDYHLKQPGVLPDAGSPAAGGGGPSVAPGATGTQGAATASIESGGNYGAVGPVANKDGNRAYGKYQVMDFNVPSWTKEVLGEPMTPQQFLANPQAQDAVYNAKMGQLRAKYGDIGAHKAWFAGETGMNNPNASDVNGMTVQRYGELAAKYGAGAGTGAPSTLGPPPGAMVDTNYAPPSGLPAVPPAGPPQQPGGPDLQAQAIAQLLPKAPVFGQGPQPYVGPQGDSTQVAPGQPAPPPQTAPPPIQTLHQYVASVMPGAKLVGNLQTGEPLYNHDGYVAVQLPNGQRTFIPPPPKPGTAQFVDVRQNPNDPNSPIIAQRNSLTNELHPRNMAGQIAIPPELANVHGDDLRNSPWYQTQSQTLRNNAEGLVSGDLPISTLSKRAGGGSDFNTTVALAQQLKPGWSPNEGVQRQVFEKSLADGNSKNGQSVQAMNIAPLHAADLLKLTDALNQQNPQAVQGIINTLKQQFGDTAVPDMNAARNLVALEFLRAAVGPAALNQALEQEFMRSISTAGTADQTRAVLKGYVSKLMGRADEMIDTGKQYGVPNIEKQIIHPRTQEALDYIKGPRIGAPGTPQGGQPVAPQPSMWDRVFGGGTAAPAQKPPRKFNLQTGALE